MNPLRLFKGFTLEPAPETGKVYSLLAGGWMAHSSPHTRNFIGGTLALSYSFE